MQTTYRNAVISLASRAPFAVIASAACMVLEEGTTNGPVQRVRYMALETMASMSDDPIENLPPRQPDISAPEAMARIDADFVREVIVVEPITKVAIGLAVSIGLKAGGKFLGPLSPITTASTMLMALDDGMRKQAAQDVLNANLTAEGYEQSIQLISEFNGTQGKAFLEEVIKKKGGGTAWYQTGHQRMECFWIYKKDFIPIKVSGSTESIGYIVHGHKDGN